MTSFARAIAVGDTVEVVPAPPGVKRSFHGISLGEVFTVTSLQLMTGETRVLGHPKGCFTYPYELKLVKGSAKNKTRTPTLRSLGLERMVSEIKATKRTLRAKTIVSTAIRRGKFIPDASLGTITTVESAISTLLQHGFQVK